MSPALAPANLARVGSSLTPDRSSRLLTSTTPHHRTNFPNAYKPPVPPGYEPPPNRYLHRWTDTIEPVTEAFAAASRGPTGIDAPSVTSSVPFDQAKMRSAPDADSEPGRIKLVAVHPKPMPPTVATPTEIKIAVPPTTGTPPHRSRSPVSGTSSPGDSKTTTAEVSSSYRTHSPIPSKTATTAEIKTSSSYRSRSPVLCTPTPMEIKSSLSYQRRSPVPSATALSGIKTSSSYQSRNSMPRNVPISPARIGAPISPARQTISSPARPFDEDPPRVTPSPSKSKGVVGANRNQDSQRQRGPPSPARASPLTTALLASDPMDPLDEPPSLAGSYRMTPPRVSTPVPRPYGETLEDEPSALTGDFSLEKPRRFIAAVPTKASEYEVVARKDVGRYDKGQEDSVDQEEDEDSLFDFEERSKIGKVDQRDRKNHNAHTDERNETSHRVHFDRLHQPAQGAWKRNQRSTAAEGLKPGVGQSPVVSFGKDDIVHNYYPAEDTLDSTTLGGRSMNSLYTKSAESEVEDIIKDIFMIGSGEGTNPGRRKIKHNPRIREHIEQPNRDEVDVTDQETVDTDDDEDASTYEDATATFTETTGTGTGLDATMYDGETTDDSASKVFPFLPSLLQPLSKMKTHSQKKGLASSPKRCGVDRDEKKEDDPLTEAWAFVGNKISAVGAALGLESPTEAPIETGATSSLVKSRRVIPKENTEAPGTGWDLWQYLLGPKVPSSCDDQDAQTDHGTPDDQRSPSLKEDNRLVDLAVHAAMSMHRVNGYEFDTSYDIDIANDIKFSVVDLSLPLGVIFQENEKGCWVTQILPNGSAASSNGNVQVGDQLAAVDGFSAIDMTVADIAKLIRGKHKEIELTFVRYVGHLRPEVGSEEGYEIRAKKLTPQKKKLTWSPPSSPMQKTRNKLIPDKSAHATTANTSSVRGILKTTYMPNGTIKSSKSQTAFATPAANINQPKRRFRLFGLRRKHSTQ